MWISCPLYVLSFIAASEERNESLLSFPTSDDVTQIPRGSAPRNLYISTSIDTGQWSEPNMSV